MAPGSIKEADNVRFIRDLDEEVERIDRLIGLNREERRSMGIILNTKQLEAVKTYILDEIAQAEAAPAQGRRRR